MTQKFITLISRSYRCYVDNANKTSNQPSNHYSCDGEQDLDGTNIKQGGRAVENGEDGSSDNSDGSRDQDGIDDGKGGCRDQDGIDDGESGSSDDGDGSLDQDGIDDGEDEQSGKLQPMNNDQRLLEYFRDNEVENEYEFSWADVERDLLIPRNEARKSIIFF